MFGQHLKNSVILVMQSYAHLTLSNTRLVSLGAVNMNEFWMNGHKARASKNIIMAPLVHQWVSDMRRSCP